MNETTHSPSDEAGWQVPAFEVTRYDVRRHKFSLVIPVINEGVRIRDQLLRIKAADLPVDIIIADGGSTDGSLDPSFLRETGVTAMLRKTGPGKLSAQLRMAYAWCIRQRYQGMVTIDGNGKDGVEAVAAMVRMLEAGYDYVQGSRYLPGGGANNTPLERNIANRLIHAPLLSIAGRRWYTDTTNGFRAYSARYLLDPRVQPFRNVFDRYELLFYLTVRAGQTGMKVGHVPVVRSYPLNVETPTKIDSLAKKMEVLRQSLDAACGRFAPRTQTAAGNQRSER
jgi:dolichol-phosphate mannosyltransferase